MYHLHVHLVSLSVYPLSPPLLLLQCKLQLNFQLSFTPPLPRIMPRLLEMPIHVCVCGGGRQQTSYVVMRACNPEAEAKIAAHLKPPWITHETLKSNNNSHPNQRKLKQLPTQRSKKSENNRSWSGREVHLP